MFFEQLTYCGLPSTSSWFGDCVPPSIINLETNVETEKQLREGDFWDGAKVRKEVKRIIEWEMENDWIEPVCFILLSARKCLFNSFAQLYNKARLKPTPTKRDFPESTASVYHFSFGQYGNGSVLSIVSPQSLWSISRSDRETKKKTVEAIKPNWVTFCVKKNFENPHRTCSVFFFGLFICIFRSRFSRSVSTEAAAPTSADKNRAGSTPVAETLAIGLVRHPKMSLSLVGHSPPPPPP